MTVELVEGRRIGICSSGTGAPALLSHCSLAHSGAWSGVMAGLNDRLCMTTIDLPGHGESEFDASTDIQDQACDTVVSILERADGPSHFIGHSFGATVALRCAVERPDLVASLCLYEPVYFSLLANDNSVAFAEHLESSAGFDSYLRAKDWPKAAELFLDDWGGEGGFAAMPAVQQKYILKTIPLILENYRTIIELHKGGLTPKDVARVSVPCLLMEGAQSPEVIHRVNDLLEESLPNVERRVFQTAAHMGPISHPTEVASAIRSFLFGDDA